MPFKLSARDGAADGGKARAGVALRIFPCALSKKKAPPKTPLEVNYTADDAGAPPPPPPLVPPREPTVRIFPTREMLALLHEVWAGFSIFSQRPPPLTGACALSRLALATPQPPACHRMAGQRTRSRVLTPSTPSITDHPLPPPTRIPRPPADLASSSTPSPSPPSALHRPPTPGSEQARRPPTAPATGSPKTTILW